MPVRNYAFPAPRRIALKPVSHFNARGVVDAPVFNLARTAVGKVSV